MLLTFEFRFVGWFGGYSTAHVWDENWIGGGNGCCIQSLIEAGNWVDGECLDVCLGESRCWSLMQELLW